MSLRSAPRRKVVEITKLGNWGEIIYRHRMECGHTDDRKRPAKAAEIGCTLCEIAREPNVPKPIPLIELDLGYTHDFQAELAWIDGVAGRIQAGLAARLKIDMEQVSVVVNGAEIGHAVIWLDHEATLRLSGVDV